MKFDAHSLAEELRQPVEDAFQQVLGGSVIPAFEQSCKLMFEQINNTFERGIEETIKNPLKEYYEELNNKTLQAIDQRLKGIGKKAKVSPQKETKDTRMGISQLLKEHKYEEAFTMVCILLLLINNVF